MYRRHLKKQMIQNQDIITRMPEQTEKPSRKQNEPSVKVILQPPVTSLVMSIEPSRSIKVLHLPMLFQRIGQIERDSCYFDSSKPLEISRFQLEQIRENKYTFMYQTDKSYRVLHDQL